MEDGGSFVVVTGIFVVVLFEVVFAAALVDAPEFAVLGEELFLLLLGLDCFFLLFLLLKILIATHILLLYSLMSCTTTFLASSFFRASEAILTVFDL